MDSHNHFNKPYKINNYIDDFFLKMKEEFEQNLTKMYLDDIEKYDYLINTIIKLPFVKNIIEENKNIIEENKNLREK